MKRNTSELIVLVVIDVMNRQFSHRKIVLGMDGTES